MSYIGLGRKKTTAEADLTGLNPGNFTNAYDHATLTANIAYFECYHFAVTELTGIAQVIVYVGNDPYSSATLSGNAEWDPSQPLLLTPDDDLYLCWNIADSGTAPVVTAWLRYDPDIQPVQVTA